MRGWILRYDTFDAEQEGVREALCTLGNGYFATRGAGEEAEADDIHYPGTYMAGGYNRLSTRVAGRLVENEDLVNFPNWLSLRFRPKGGNWFNLRAVEVISFRQELDLRMGVLERAVRIRDLQGRITTVHSRRLVHMECEHLAAIRLTIQPENWSGPIEIRSALDGRVVNAGVARYRQLRGDHLEPIDTGVLTSATNDDDCIWLRVRTRQSRMELAQAARTRVLTHNQPVDCTRELVEQPGYIADHITVNLEQNESVTVEKTVAVYSSRDHAISECSAEARAVVLIAPDFDALLSRHARAWNHLWRRCDIVFSEATGKDELILRLHIFHLLQTASMNTVDQDFGIPARGLHGEAYRGHIFWDELFIFPFLNLRIPEMTRAMLRYRYRRLPAARHLAAEAGFRGAMYPWQSGSNGREETQRLHLNPRSGRWLPDHTHLQRHVNAAIAFNIWQYTQATGDLDFLASFGAEMFLEIARFWASMSVRGDHSGRWEIHNVVGPDEYHDRYPERHDPGVHNNAYTNVMAAWVLHKAGEILNMVEPARQHELRDTLELDDAELGHWIDISRAMFVPFHGHDIISQFEGYDDLHELDWDRYRRTYGDIHRLDRILEAEGDDVNRYKVSKQADVLMLLYVFTEQKLHQIFGRMGYNLSHDALGRTIDYYRQRTDHGSTLSRVVHSWVLARYDSAHAWQLFREALRSDVNDIQRGTTHEGIHLGAMAGTVDLVQRCFSGIVVREDVLHFDPALPDELGDLRLRLRFRHQWLNVRLSHQDLIVTLDPGTGKGVDVGFQGQVRRLEPGQCHRFALVHGHALAEND